MADKYTSRIALVLDEPVANVEAVVRAAGKAGDIDRASPVRGQAADAQEVHWGGRMQKAVIRRVVDEEGDGAPMLRTETYIGGDGVTQGMTRQAQLLQALARQFKGRVVAVRDLSASTEHDLAWMNRVAIGAVELDDAIVVRSDGEGVWWTHTHGAARFDVPDLELYGVPKAKVPAAQEVLRHLHGQLLDKGLKAALDLPSGEPVYLVPVLDAWQHLSLDWPGVGKAGEDRSPDLVGPRATVSLLHKPRLGRYRKDFEGVISVLPTSTPSGDST